MKGSKKNSKIKLKKFTQRVQQKDKQEMGENIRIGPGVPVETFLSSRREQKNEEE